MISTQGLRNLMRQNNNDSKKLDALKVLLKEISPGSFKCYNIPLILTYFLNDTYRFDALKFMIDQIDKITESTFESISYTFKNNSHEKVNNIIINKFPDAEIFEPWDDEYLNTEQSFIINDIEFKQAVSGSVYDKMSIYGRPLSIKIIGDKLRVKYNNNYRLYDFVDRININISPIGDICIN